MYILRKIYIASLLIFLSCLSFSEPSTAAPTDKLHNILILHSYHKGLGWTDGITAGIETTLCKSGLVYELFYEFLDSKRIADDKHSANLAETFRHKYVGRRFAAIILSDDFAFNFMLRYREELFPDTPVVFCGVNFFEDAMLDGHPLMTGVVESFSLQGTIDGALHINPSIRKVVAISDNTITGLANQKLLNVLMPQYKDRLQFELIGRQTMGEIQKRCSHLPEEAIVLLLSFTQDSAGEIFSLERSADLLTPHCSVPVFSFWDFHLHHGVLGGKLTTGLSHGEKAAELTLRILRGEAVDAIPVVKESPNRYIFDYSVMQRFAINEDRLPEDSTVINKPVSLYSQYKVFFWQIFAAFIFLIIVICLISFNLVRRRRAEKALRRSEERMRTIFQAAKTVAFVITDARVPEPTIIEFSPGAETIFGYSRGEVIGRPVSILHRAEDVATFPQGRKQMVESRQGLYRQAILVRKNGETFPALFSSHPLFDEHGIMRATLGVSIDITEQKKTEAALRESIERFRELSELLPETIFEIDFSGKVLFLNNSGMEQFDFTAEDLAAGINAYDFFPGDEKDKLKRNLARLLNGEQIGLSEYLVCDKNGITFPVMTSSMVIYREGKPVGLRGFLIDIREKKQLEENLRNAQRMESIGTLAGGIAHDFNNILMGIQGRTSLSLMQLKETSPLKEHLDCIEDYVKSAAHLTSQLLGFARSGKYHLESTDINEMVEKTLKMFGRTRKELILVHTLQADLPAVQVDRNQIEQVLLNLFVNAWQAMPKGGRLEVATRACEIDESQGQRLSLSPGRYVQLLVTDTGIGIDAGIQQKIFEPFFTTKTRGRGTGLGLASAYGIVRNHRGTIVVESKVGEGATFLIYLPATEARPQKTVESAEEVREGNESILLVDDEPMVLQVASAILNHLGYTVHTVGSGREAVLWYREHGDTIDLIVLDMIMPEMSGEETFSRLQAINPQVKVLLSSGYSLEGQAEKILAHGCLGFIQKPFDLLQFSRKIREVLDGGADN